MSRRYALFSSGASFGRAVLDELVRLQQPPQWVVLPQYPPASAGPGDSLLDVASPGATAWPRDRVDAEILYSPRRLQAQCARRLEGCCDFLLVACWPWLIDPLVIRSVSRAALNLHPSLLPAFRGANPVGEQIATGDPQFGVTLHLLSNRIDHGDIVAQRAIPGNHSQPTVAGVEAECARQGARLFADALRQFPCWQPRPQPDHSIDTD